VYAKTLFDNDVPVIYNTDHLSAHVGYSKSYLKRAVSHPKSFYRRFIIPKKNGGTRYLAEPLPSLKEIQRWILENILYKKEVHPYAKAYSPGRTIKDNLKYHKKKAVVLSLDIEHFFDSITSEKVENIFRTFGYSSIVSSILTKLIMLNGALAQGAPTSPHVSNLVLFDFDSTIQKFSFENKFMYTRYADDLTFSSSNLNPDLIISFVEKELLHLNLKLNGKKTHLMPSSKRQVVTGVVVNEKIQAKRDYRMLIRQEMHFIKKFGLASHIKKKKIKNKNYLKHLIGKINYSLFLNPNDSELAGYKTYLIGLIGT